jgi:predicted RNA-binding protein with PIN domain
MTLLVDCYNLLHASMPPSLAGLDEAWLCRLLAVSRPAEGRIVVICDGLVKPAGPQRSPIAAVQLVYSGKERSADDLIIDSINRDTAPRRLTVVSNDRKIQNAARRRRARLCTCAQMIHELAGTIGAPALPQDSSKPIAESLTDTQVRQWLKTFGLDSDAPIGRKPP